jgi:hypothetical protein
MNTTAHTKAMPRGSEFLETAAKVETHCSEISLSEIPKLGLSTPACYEFLGDVLSMLYEEASCFHGCVGGDHLVQRLTARIVTNSLSSLRLAILGYYDESSALTRTFFRANNQGGDCYERQPRYESLRPRRCRLANKESAS